jgi:hypothetical protein
MASVAEPHSPTGQGHQEEVLVDNSHESRDISRGLGPPGLLASWSLDTGPQVGAHMCGAPSLSHPIYSNTFENEESLALNADFARWN